MKKHFTTTILVAVIALLGAVNFLSFNQTRSEIESLKNSVNNKTNKVIVYEGRDGYTPVKNIDYKDGVNGLNAVSYSVQTNTIKEVPVRGEIGKSAYDIWIELGNIGTKDDFIESLKAPQPDIQLTQINPNTLDMQIKMSSWETWRTIVYCSEYRLVCPNGN